MVWVWEGETKSLCSGRTNERVSHQFTQQYTLDTRHTNLSKGRSFMWTKQLK